jgi:hypothetical protein
MRADTKKQTQMHAKGTDVGSSLATDPEDTKVALIVELVKLALVDCADTELALDGGNQRWALEERAGEGLESASELGLAAGELVVETDDAHVFLSGALLRLDETGRAVDADDQAAGDFGVESSAVAGLLDSVEGSVPSPPIAWYGLYIGQKTYLSMRLTHATTSWEDGLEGLSRLITPEEMYDFRSLLSGVQPFGIGVKCPVRTRTVQ